MTFRELSSTEFKNYADTSPVTSFYQTEQWGKLKEVNGWHYQFVGVIKDDKVVAATMLLSKQTPLRKKMFYAPRGFLLDYNDKKLLAFFTKEIKTYVKKNKGIFLKLDPYLIYKERDIDGNIVSDGINNQKTYEEMIKLGYKHFGFNLYNETLQPRWMFVKDIKDKTDEQLIKDMEHGKRQRLNRNNKMAIITRELDYNELELFKDIMQHTSDRRDFVDRPLSYYQNMYNVLSKDGMIKILLTELHAKEEINRLKKDKEQLTKTMEEQKLKFEQNPQDMNGKKYKLKKQQNEEELKRIDTKLIRMKELQKEHGDIIPLSGFLYILNGKEILSLVGGSFDEFMEFQAAYTTNYEMMKFASKNGYERYNFYGITGDFDPNNPLYGLYVFKRGFGGTVVELMGEFDLIVNPFYYHLYKISFAIYHKAKIVKKHLTTKRKKTGN